MSNPVPHVSQLPADKFVDPDLRRYPITSQEYVDLAAQDIAPLYWSHPYRMSLTDLARSAGFLLPVAFTEEVESRRKKYHQVCFNDQTLTVESASTLALTEGGRKLLADRGLKPNPTAISAADAAATFSGSPYRASYGPTTADRQAKSLAMTIGGRELLRARGYRADEIAALEGC